MKGQNSVDKRPSLFLRLHAKLAWHAYQKAEKPYRKLVREMESLETEREAILNADRERRLAGEASDNQALGRDMLRISDRFHELNKEWEKVDARMKAASERARRVLRALGVPSSERAP